jgi:thioredoxin reductase
MRGTKEYDVVVVGGGAAGLSAAWSCYEPGAGWSWSTLACRATRRPRACTASCPGMACPPRELLAAGRSELSSYGGHLIDDTVVGVEPGFYVQLANGSPLGARPILVATGLRDELPDIPGVWERWGRDLLHCPYCHGHEDRDQPLGVLGGAPEAVQHALLVRQWSPDVILFHIPTPSAGSNASS